MSSDALWIEVGKVSVGAFVGFVASLFVVWRTNRGHEKRLLTQLTHDAGERKQQREFELKRTLYVEALDALANLHRVVTDPTWTLRNSQPLIEEIQKLNSTVERVTLAGNEKVTVAAKTYGYSLAVFLKRHIDQIREVDALKLQREVAVSTAQQLRQEGAKVHDAALKHMGIAADDARFVELMNAGQSLQGHSQQSDRDVAIADRALVIAVNTLALAMVEPSHRLAREARGLIAAMRQDLGLGSLDLQPFEPSDAQIQVAKAELENRLKELEKKAEANVQSVR